MLSGKEILEEVRNGKINISYSFLPYDGSGNKVDRFLYQGGSIKATQENNIAFEYLKGQIVRDRIAMSAGAIYRPFASGRVPKHLRFSGHNDLVDITKDSAYYMKPGEVGLVISNECIDFKSDHSALIVSRVSNYPIGLVIRAAYIDSTSMGLLRFVLTNVSDKPVQLRVGQDLARVFVFKTSNPFIDDRIMGEVSPHYGQNWPRILNDGLHPFQSLRGNTDWYWAYRIKAWLKTNGMTLSVATIFAGLLAAAPVLYNLANEIRDMSTTQESIKKLQEQSKVKTSQINELNLLRRLQGTTTITIQDGRSHASKTITIDNKKQLKGGSVFVSTNDDYSSVYFSAVMEINSKNITVNIKASRKDTNGEKSYSVNWVVFPI